MKKLLILLSFITFAQFTIAQETDYDNVYVNVTLPALRPQYTSYKTFDLSVFTTQAEDQKQSVNFQLPYEIKVARLQQVNSGGDFHIVTLLQRYAGKLTSFSSATLNISLITYVYDRAGKYVTSIEVNKEAYVLNFGRELSQTEAKDQNAIRKIVMEKIIGIMIEQFEASLYPSKEDVNLRIASVDDVKKKPELQDFEKQLKEIKPVYSKMGFEGYKIAAQPYVAYWEKMTGYTDTDIEKANEVKRAAFQNLVLFQIASGNIEKAKEYIEQYKAVDKIVKEMMGLLKYRNSDELELFINRMYPENKPAAAEVSAETLVTKEQVALNFEYIFVKGTITISGKRDGGTYTGLIKVKKIKESGFGGGGILSLDPETIPVMIETTDDAGKPKTIRTSLTKIEMLKGENGDEYHVQKFGIMGLGDGTYYTFMKSTYKSEKVKVYRTILPEGGSEYYVIKSGDEKGHKSAELNARKKLLEYLSDNPVIAEAAKNGTIPRTETVEKIAEMYSGNLK